MKILIFSDSFPPYARGGAGVIAERLAKEYKRKGHSVSVITTVRDKKEEGRDVRGEIALHKIYSNYHPRWKNYRSLYNPPVITKVKKLIREIQPDVVHAHNIHYHISYYALRLAKKSGAAVFLTAHDVMTFHYGKLTEFIDRNTSCSQSFNYKVSILEQIKRAKKRYNPFRNIAIRFFLRYIDKVIAVSNALKDALNQNKIDNVTTIHNGINVGEWIVPDKIISRVRKKHGLDDKKVLLFGGRLSPAKGTKQALKMLQKVIPEVKDVALVVIGEKRRTHHVQKVAQSLGVEDYVCSTGWVAGEELKALFHIADVVLTPSICFDSFPNVNLEAFSCGTPVVGTCFGGTPEVVINGKTGYTLNPFSTEEFSEKVITLLKNTDLKKRLGEAGKEMVQSKFSSERQRERHLNLFFSNLKSKN